MENTMKILIVVIVLTSIFSCEDYVSNISPYYDRLLDDELNTESNVPIFINGLENQLAFTVDDLFLAADGLSDQLIFDLRNKQATAPDYQYLDMGFPLDYRGDNVQGFNNAHELRVLADTLIYRVKNKIAFTDQNLLTKALHAANFHSAYAYYLLATYYGRSETSGGSPINLSNFIPSSVLYQTAINKWKESLNYTTDAARKRIVNSLIARVYLFTGDYANANLYAEQGMIKGDAPLICQYNSENDNAYRTGAGQYRTQLSVDPRFNEYRTSDPTEATRLPLQKLIGTGGFVYWRQLKYIVNPDNTVSPIVLMDWQENNLMKAELAVRGVGSGDALSLINAVRTSHSVSQLPAGTTITLTNPTTTTSYSIYEERDKELFVRGNRLVDQRRFNLMHIPGMWQYMPISRDEKNRNPNWNK